MYDPAPRRGPLTSGERWLFAILLIAFFGLFGAEIVHDYQPAKLSAVLVVFFWIPLLALHEAGHALMAASLNWYVGQIVIGMGRKVGSFRIGSAVVEIRVFPVEGFVKCVPRDLKRPQLKSALIYFAGPGIELLLAAGILLAIGPHRLFARTDDYMLILWQSLAIASVAQGVINLIPNSTRTPQGEVPNDGMGIIRSFFIPIETYAAMMAWTYREVDDDELEDNENWRGGEE